ncbi:hypothetical protein [Saccharibacillus sacchari]|uniref:Uncharacterized protein n=1 Tax=Saccharibacillus sacchari TaxID=456493 RepID=A0ACC6PD86_9BACL
MVGAKLTVRKDGQTTVSEGGLGVGAIEQTEDGSPRFVFTFDKTALPQNPDSVSFSVEGIEALNAEERKLIVDTDTKKVLQAPEKGITAAVNSATSGTKQLQIGYPVDAEQFFGSDPSSMLFLDTTFTDAVGAEYPLTYPSDGSLFGEVLPTSKSALASFVFVDRNYAQPLTFTILAYPKETLEYREIRLK